MSEEDRDYINVTAAIIQEGQNILIVRRAQNQSHAGKWEFPGGKIDPGETAEDCLRRELLEELGIRVQEVQSFIVFEYDYHRSDRKKHRFFSFWCMILEGILSLRVHDSLEWVKIEDLSKFDIIEADRQLVKALLENQKGGEAL
ncbi:8-oxo-dGTP diphosphatase MutT [Patescibacteria group bacterium]|nr:8-oxo-dGTP diphosphatase MutT [Patescibacteria group bacterium]